MGLDVNQRMLLDLLSCAIKNITPVIERDACDWNEVYSLACWHRVDTFLYPVIKQLKKRNNDIIDHWCIEALMETFDRVDRMNEIKTVLDAFDKAGIHIVLLKGIVLRDLYPFPELRTMSDIDILLKKEDLLTGTELLRTLGYTEKCVDYRVSAFSHPKFMPIELHTNLLYPELFSEMKFLENCVWDYKEEYENSRKSTFVLATEFNIVYLILHAFIHFSKSGVGLRQLCDIAILIDKKKDRINWTVFWDLMITAKKQNFAMVILAACSRFLNIEIDPKNMIKPVGILTEHVDTFILELIQGGVFGHLNKGRGAENLILGKANGRDDKKYLQCIRVTSNFIFPSVSNLSDRFDYARKMRFLLPIAWVHRILSNLIKRSALTSLYLKRLCVIAFSKEHKSYLKAIDLVK